ncbi:hypothetical protein MAFF211491_20950 [Ralstonia solanacearum]|nr:hypothetical protein MAFF211491_20950 [Ralstonia solanacearum]BCM13085.1 hypothetical protein MAFF241648_22750 [Ralstonia solanacearum]
MAVVSRVSILGRLRGSQPYACPVLSRDMAGWPDAGRLSLALMRQFGRLPAGIPTRAQAGGCVHTRVDAGIRGRQARERRGALADYRIRFGPGILQLQLCKKSLITLELHLWKSVL